MRSNPHMENIISQKPAFQHLLDISIQLNSEKNNDVLMEKILLATIDISNADAGSIYLVNKNNELEFRTIINKSLAIHYGGSSDKPITFPAIPLLIDGQANTSAIVAHAANTGQVINLADAYDGQPFDFSSARAMDSKTGYHTQSILTLPLQDHTKDIIGVIQLINAIEQGRIISFSEGIERQILSFASLAAIALTNKTLIVEMEKLFESFAKTIAAAIDEKSPHTGGHCKRVPELTLMIADAVHQQQSGPLTDFNLSSANRHQLSIAGWLHDCGKIGTPDHIIDKSKKLHTLFDRIDYVNAKIELACRDIDICHQANIIKALKAGDTTAIEQLEQAREASQTQLNVDRTFLQKTNVGGEFLTDEELANIKTISQRYSITLDGVQQPLLTDDEIHNLSIRRGTLNDEERLIIQRHMNITQNILESLPFPKHLDNVVEYALGHHETLDGKGYPRGLTKEQMSVPARVMAIADIFEALSASDRPYKPAKPVSECLKIMGTMVTKNHLDGDLFTIFVRSKVYEDYIHKFANPAQLDNFDLESIPGLQPL